MEKRREYGIDLLRIISMFMVTVLHTLGRGNGLGNIKDSNLYNTAYFLEIAAFSAVNIYALISGYVGVNSKFKISRILYIYIQVIFYTILIFLIYRGSHPELVTKECLEKTFRPIYFTHYWYITAYFGLFLLTPLINYGMRSIPKNIITPTLFIIVIMYILFPYFYDVTAFGVGYGYSMPWLLILYIFGAYIKIFDPFKNINKRYCFYIYLLSTIFTQIFTNAGYPSLVNYNSITIFIQGLSLVVLFSKINIEKKFISSTISLLTKLTLGVYIIHINWFIWRVQVNNFAISIGDSVNSFEIIYKTLFYALKIFVPCMLVDLVRYYIFELLHIRKLLSYIDKLFERKNSELIIE